MDVVDHMSTGTIKVHVIIGEVTVSWISIAKCDFLAIALSNTSSSTGFH